MHKVNILAITPYKNLESMIIEIARTYPNINVDTFTGILDTAEAYVNSISLDKYDIILSRGRTAYLLRTMAEQPVLFIDVTVYDFLRVFKTAELHGGKFFITSDPSFIATARTLIDILEYDVEVFPFESEQECRDIILRHRDAGYNLMIGDVLGVQVAQNLGLAALLITSSEESIRKTFDEAIQIHHHIRHTTNKLKVVKKALQCGHRHTLVAGDDLEPLYTSEGMLEQLHMFTATLKAYAPRLELDMPVVLYKAFGSGAYRITLQAFTENRKRYYALYADPYETAQGVKSCISVVNADDPPPRDYIFSSSEYKRPLLDKLQYTSGSLAPVYIWGEAGTGRENMARHIHRESIAQDHPLIIIDCPTLTEKAWNAFVDDLRSPIHDLRYALYLKQVDSLSPDMQRILHEYMEHCSVSYHHLVLASAGCNIHSLATEKGFLPALCTMLSGITIHMPPLRERPEDIPAFASLCINSYNAEHATQVIALNAGAIEALQAYPWELNIEQLQHVIKQLVLTVDKPYITREDVDAILGAHAAPADEWHSPLDLSQPLEEIERAIIRHVVKEENMIYTNAAKRLGISRSTLWRKLRDTDWEP